MTQSRNNFLPIVATVGLSVYCNRLLGTAGISVADEYEDVGENHYFDALKKK
jgi:hypothetical protein